MLSNQHGTTIEITVSGELSGLTWEKAFYLTKEF